MLITPDLGRLQWRLALRHAVAQHRGERRDVRGLPCCRSHSLAQELEVVRAFGKQPIDELRQVVAQPFEVLEELE
jgi:hypothetical protein